MRPSIRRYFHPSPGIPSTIRITSPRPGSRSRRATRAGSTRTSTRPFPRPTRWPGVSAASLDLVADLSRFDDELETLFRLSLDAFDDNLYYTPIDLDSFRAMYQGTRALIDPELVLLAHDRSGRLVAYQFAFPDPLSRAAGRPTRVIVKTVATAPEARGLGIASHMLDLIRERARAKGYRAVIHALMHVSNFSVRMSVRHHGEIFRRYALYQWTP